jgi:hypothetical protein
MILTIVIKPGVIQQVNAGPGRPDGWTGPGKVKDQTKQKHGRLIFFHMCFFT